MRIVLVAGNSLSWTPHWDKNSTAPSGLRHDAATRFWKSHNDLALLMEFLGDRDTESVMRYVNIDGKEASRLMRKRKSARQRAQRRATERRARRRRSRVSVGPRRSLEKTLVDRRPLPTSRK
jgi:hypothetical protein